LQNEDEDHNQGGDANHERRPRSAHAGLSLARKRFPLGYILVRACVQRCLT
jgi:hypothetical protein